MIDHASPDSLGEGLLTGHRGVGERAGRAQVGNQRGMVIGQRQIEEQHPPRMPRGELRREVECDGRLSRPPLRGVNRCYQHVRKISLSAGYPPEFLKRDLLRPGQPDVPFTACPCPDAELEIMVTSPKLRLVSVILPPPHVQRLSNFATGLRRVGAAARRMTAGGE